MTTVRERIERSNIPGGDYHARLFTEYRAGNLVPADEVEARIAEAVAATADDLRAKGWAVAVHNDYRLNGEAHTFWLFTRAGRAVKGEGRTDAEALDAVRAAIRGDDHDG